MVFANWVNCQIILANMISNFSSNLLKPEFPIIKGGDYSIKWYIWISYVPNTELRNLVAKRLCKNFLNFKLRYLRIRERYRYFRHPLNSLQILHPFSNFFGISRGGGFGGNLHFPPHQQNISNWFTYSTVHMIKLIKDVYPTLKLKSLEKVSHFQLFLFTQFLFNKK